MGSIADYLEDALLDHIFNGVELAKYGALGGGFGAVLTIAAVILKATGVF